MEEEYSMCHRLIKQVSNQWRASIN